MVRPRYPLYRAELEVVLRDQHHNIGYGNANVELEDVVRWLIDEEGVEVWEHNGDPSVAVKAGRYLLVRLPDEEEVSDEVDGDDGAAGR